MLNNKPASARVLAIGLMSSLLAVVAIGLTLLADNGSLGLVSPLRALNGFPYYLLRSQSASFTSCFD